MAKDKALVGAAGVHYVAFRLSSRGYAVGITAPGIKLVDLLATKTETGKTVSIQVKTMTTAFVNRKKGGAYWKWQVREELMANEARADIFFAFVDLRGGPPRDSGDVSWAPDVFVVPSKDLRRVRAAGSSDGWFCIHVDEAPDHQNRWDIIEDRLNK